MTNVATPSVLLFRMLVQPRLSSDTSPLANTDFDVGRLGGVELAALDW